MIYIIIGGPATGKGTRAQILSNYVKVPHISTGELLRIEAKKDDKLAEKLSKGELITDEIVTEVLYKRIIQEDCNDGFILDGYPRTYVQVLLLDKVFEKIGKKTDKVIELAIPDELALKRILTREICVDCKKTYGMDFRPKVKDVCDACGGKLVKRTDDTEEVLKKRIDTYKKEASKILEHYNKKGVLETMDASEHPEEIVKIVK